MKHTQLVGLLTLLCPCLVHAADVASPTGTTLPSPALSADTEGDFVIGPPYANAPELTARQGIPRGVVSKFVMDSRDSKLFPGISKNSPGVVPFTRNVSVYVPSQYVPGTQAPFIVCQDANELKILPTILDNMIADHRVPALVAVFVANGGGDAQGSERGLEYDTVSGKYAEFVQSEVLPRVSFRGSHYPKPGSRRPGSTGQQFRRRGGHEHGLVPHRMVPPCADFLRNLCQSTVAGKPGIA